MTTRILAAIAAMQGKKAPAMAYEVQHKAPLEYYTAPYEGPRQTATDYYIAQQYAGQRYEDFRGVEILDNAPVSRETVRSGIGCAAALAMESA